MSSKQPTSRPRSTALVPDFSLADYSRFFAAGALCCTLTHGGMTPVDVVKTRVQIDPALRGQSLLKAGRQIVAKEGAPALLTGFGPTAVGYLVQGGLKFSLYEFWKRKLVQLAGSHEEAVKHRTAIYLVGASLAEFIADIALTPLEATRIRLVSDPKYASGLASGFTRLASEGGLRELYAGFVPILAKQVPYAIGQFWTNEKMHEIVNRSLSPETRKNISKPSELGITLGCGMVAGVAAAVLSHPADTLLSKINKGGGDTSLSASKRLVQLAREAGPRGLFVGLGPRIWMTVGLVSGQFLLYKSIKDALGAPDGVEIHGDGE